MILSTLTWRILALILLILLVIVIFLLIKLNLLKNHYYFDYVEDTLVDERMIDEETKQKEFIVNNESKKYIKKYLIAEDKIHKYLILNYNESYAKARVYVIEYDKKGNVVDVLRVTELQTTSKSRVILLNAKTIKVNIIIGRINDTELNYNVIVPLSKSKIRIYSLLKALMLFSIGFVTRHFFIELCAGIFKRTLLNSMYDYIFIGVIFLLSLIYYWMNAHTLKKRNRKIKDGGRLSYEFI